MRFTADFRFATGLQRESKVAPARHSICAKAVVPALGALHRRRRLDRPKALAALAKIHASGSAH